MKSDPQYKTFHIELPLTNLHIMEAGEGPVLIIVPATISKLEDWTDLIFFMSQWFHVYFFELPGHGTSSPFSKTFSTDLVAETVEDFVNHLGVDHFNVMGFSFGGILAMKSYLRLQPRIDRLIFIAPCLSHQAIQFTKIKKVGLGAMTRYFSRSKVQKRIFEILKSPRKRSLFVTFLQAVTKAERGVQLEEKMAKIQPATFEVLLNEMQEILKIKFNPPDTKFETPCYLAMSIHDPLLDYQRTIAEAKKHFANVTAIQLYYPFHQPPRPFTYEEYQRDFHSTVDEFLLNNQ